MQSSNMIFVCVGVMYSGEYDMFVMLLWVYIHTGQAWKICLATVGIESTTFGILAKCSANNIPTIFQYSKGRKFNIPKVVGSIPAVARHIFQACPVWICTQSNITNIIFTWVHNINTQKIL
jgi:hypothetical protein